MSIDRSVDRPALVSCIMPTHNRRHFVAQAIAYFLRQDYPAKELVVVDDGSDPVGDLIPADERIRYLRLAGRATVGAKRNLAVARARGEILAHWDDDDWHAPHRLRYQVEVLQRDAADLCGLDQFLFFDPSHGQAWLYAYPRHQRLGLAGSTLCYRRWVWERHPFPNVDVGEDVRFVEASQPCQLTLLPDPAFHVGIIHRHNVSPKITGGANWRPYPIEEIRRLIGSDWAFYTQTTTGATEPPARVNTPEQRPTDQIAPARDTQIDRDAISRRLLPVMTVAKTDDLALPEFLAFNQGQALPWMRRWELPFALFQARLDNCSAVLDCTINPVSFQERLTRLYPHILYRHLSPIQNGRFVLPVGVPDAAFDRVICINTLEHLLRPQREALVADLARKLKPGGVLVLTSDYYFDKTWDQAAFIQAGVVRPDRQEIFNGWNRVSPSEWLELAQRNGLTPLGDPMDDPREDDPSLYRSQHHYPHACIGGLFAKGAQPSLPAGKRVVLALLTWNTRDVSVDSFRAHLREARMLRRLGQQPFLCVCDNGSGDGTAEAIQGLADEVDLPHKLIFNKRNLGNSIARNQIVDYAREVDADYILFVDGDIEVVPFSSFAMLRYLENNGHRLGCIGADSVGQTPFRERATPAFYAIDGARIETTALVAWTQYGLFRVDMFRDGVRFDETEPFNQAGWGFEDNDLAFQMEIKGYLNQRFFGMTYLHRNARSSIRIMREKGIDAASLYARRKQYVIEKWASVSSINAGPLMDVRRVEMRI